jgi:hypothetical protein
MEERMIKLFQVWCFYLLVGGKLVVDKCSI